MKYYLVTTDMHSGNAVLCHYGIEGMRWGLRRYQNPDGSLTAEGRERYHRAIARSVKKHESFTNQNRYGGLIGGLSNQYIHRNENKVKKKIDQEFDKSYGKAISNTAQKAMKMEKQLKETYGTLEGAPKRKLAKLQELKSDAENEQKLIVNEYNRIENKYKKEMMEAKLKDMKIDVIEDGAEFLDRLLSDDSTATYDVPTFWDKVFGKAPKDEPTANSEKPEYIEKIEKNGETRYFYDKDELKAYKKNEPDSLIKWKVPDDPKSRESQRELGEAYAKMWNGSKSAAEAANKKKAWETARDKDKWDITFLEAVQNSKILHDNDTVALLTEYAKYLDDPEDYFMNRGYKLKPV